MVDTRNVFVVNEETAQNVRRFHTVREAESWIANLKSPKAVERRYRGLYGIDYPEHGISFIPSTPTGRPRD